MRSTNSVAKEICQVKESQIIQQQVKTVHLNKQIKRNQNSKQVGLKKQKLKLSEEESQVFLNLIPKKEQLSGCCTCGKQQNKFIAWKKLKDIKYELILLSKQVQSVKEEVHLLLANFSFILELTAENLNRETAARVQKILRQKNQTIQRQREKISFLEESQIEIKNQKEDSYLNIKDQLGEALKKIQQLQTQNKGLKQLNASTKNSQSSTSQFHNSYNFQDMSINLKKTSDSSSNGIYPIVQESESPTYSSQYVQSRKYKVKKRNTLGNGQNQMTVATPPEIQSKIKSLGNLKLKIHKLKNELQQGYPTYN